MCKKKLKAEGGHIAPNKVGWLKLVKKQKQDDLVPSHNEDFYFVRVRSKTFPFELLKIKVTENTTIKQLEEKIISRLTVEFKEMVKVGASLIFYNKNKIEDNTKTLSYYSINQLKLMKDNKHTNKLPIYIELTDICSKEISKSEKFRKKLLDEMEKLMTKNIKWCEAYPLGKPRLPDKEEIIAINAGKLSRKDIKKPELRSWLQNKTKKEPTMMNCWESVLYATVKANLRTKKWALDQMSSFSNGEKKKANRLVLNIINSGNKARKTNQGPLTIEEDIPLGYVVAFGENGQHVALSTGLTKKVSDKDEHEIIELDNDKGEADFRKNTIENAIRKMPAYGDLVSWGPLP